ncbi:MAG: amylo-alpha-1,6-glucosidase [Chloroflexi bacterium]|nr:amylo-alpha-1,6-glucosidase [Chloroflexota bacterium]
MATHPTPGTVVPAHQPYLHDLAVVVAAPTAVLSGMDGQIRAGGAQGVLSGDRRVLSELRVEIDGIEPYPVGHALIGADEARFVAILRDLGDKGLDPTVRLERTRHVRPSGLSERLRIDSSARVPIRATLSVALSADFAGIGEVKAGRGGAAMRGATTPDGICWADDETTVEVHASGGAVVSADRLSWQVDIAAHEAWEATIDVTATEALAPPGTFVAAPGAALPDHVAMVGPPALVELVNRGVRDVRALALADPQVTSDTFIAAGVPWFLTLFGRDSLWAARFSLPLGTDLAVGTLRTLGRRQGRRNDPETGEAPGKILHEVRRGASRTGLPPTYFGSIDATALWVCLLYDAWRWGLSGDDVIGLLDPLEAALGWMTTAADADGDGFLEYLDTSGRGLANQGWKDSGDSIQFPDGSLPTGAIALVEAQGYAYHAAIGGARMLESFGRPGADRLRQWALELRERFRQTFWVSDARGRFPAIALDGSKRPIGTATSNPGHLLATGILDPDEIASIAARLSEPDLDGGYGLRTMSSDVAGFNPLGYHTGSVWPHDTTIAVGGLAATGHARVAASLAGGLMRAAPTFMHRLPELFAGTDARAGDPVLAYPAACRPIAWAAAAPIALLQAALGIDPDVPAGRLRVAPHAAFSAWFPLRIGGLRIAGQHLSVAVSTDGRTTVETDAPIAVEAGDAS